MDTISVLLVDDNPTFLRMAARFLDSHDGVRVLATANGGREALCYAETLRPDIVLIDLAMSDLHGLEAIPLLRQMQPRLGIIALTLLDTNGYREAALSAGANDFVPKANLGSELLPAIRRVAGANGAATK